MFVYIWVAVMGLIGIAALSSFVFSLVKDIKLKKKQSLSGWFLLPNWILFFISIGSFSMMTYFFFNIKDQLLQYG